jgi:hypothetical protein
MSEAEVGILCQCRNDTDEHLLDVLDTWHLLDRKLCVPGTADTAWDTKLVSK